MQSPSAHMKAIIERNVIYASLFVQALLTLSVVGFCAVQLNRCPVGASTLESGADAGLADVGACPRALYTNMITAAVSYWFPAPWYAFVSSSKEVHTPRKRTTKVNAEETTVVDEDK